MIEKLLVVNSNDVLIGIETREKCHSDDGILHRAVSTFIFNSKNQLLLTQRSMSKKLWPEFWDASCSTHVFPNESYEQAGERRLLEELGFSCKLKILFKFQYQAKYKNIGSENEICALLVGEYNDKVVLNPKEVLNFKWTTLNELKKNLGKNPEQYTPWLKIAFRKFLEINNSEVRSP